MGNMTVRESMMRLHEQLNKFMEDIRPHLTQPPVVSANTALPTSSLTAGSPRTPLNNKEVLNCRVSAC